MCVLQFELAAVVEFSLFEPFFQNFESVYDRLQYYLPVWILLYVLFQLNKNVNLTLRSECIVVMYYNMFV